MRLATILDGGLPRPVVVRDERVLPIAQPLNELAANGPNALRRVAAWADAQPAATWRPVEQVRLGPAVADPGAIYTVGLNYDGPGAAPRPERPLIYGKAVGSVAGHGATLAWDRSVTDDVDAEIELGVVIGAGGTVFGYTCVNDISARDEHLDGDQWLLGKSMPGFCPVGPWIVTADDFDPSDVGLACSINGEPIQDDRTSRMRFRIPEIIEFLGRHLELRPGDLIAAGTPVRLTTPPGPSRRLRLGDTATVSIEGIGELTTIIA
jgi:2,4-didehydro-3-deoxy-L-rhamnonate hydrolase